MGHKCSYDRVLEVFFKEPTRIHFIKEIGKKISLAHTSVRNQIRKIEKEGLIIKKEARPFWGFVANRENERFLFEKQVYNLGSLFDLIKEIVLKLAPKAIILFGSYQKGEDIEESDIDLVVISKIKKELNPEKYEKSLGRKIHITLVESTNSLGKNVRDNIKNGWILYGNV